MVSLILAGSLVQPLSSTAAAKENNNYLVYGFPAGQQGLEVYADACDGGEVAADDWPFEITYDEPPPYGPSAVGWIPAGSGGAYGLSTYFAQANEVDVWQIDAFAPTGQAHGFARVDYFPTSGQYSWVGFSDEFVNNEADWHTIDASDWQYDWFRMTDGEFDGTVIESVALEAFTDERGAGGAYFDIYLGCDGNPFFIDGYQVGSSVGGWDTFNLEDFLPAEASLAPAQGPISTCQSSQRFPNRVTFKGSISPGGDWRGWQYRGQGKAQKWKLIDDGSTSGRFRYSASVSENSFFDADRPGTLDTRYVDSPDIYVPAFAEITLRSAKAKVRKGTPMVFAGTIKPARRTKFSVLRADQKGRGWSKFSNVGKYTTDRKGKFRFKVPTAVVGWHRINILTKSGNDMTSTINRRAILYEVLKPKVKPPTHSNPPPANPEPNTDQPAPPPPGPPPPHGRPAGYGSCGWYPTGGPPKRVSGRGDVPFSAGEGVAAREAAPAVRLPAADSRRERTAPAPKVVSNPR